MSSEMRIGEVAAQAGVNVQTLRYYERRGLLEEPERRPSGYRTYAPEAVRLVRFIKKAQDLGFSLREIRELLSLKAAPRSRCADVQARAEAKIQEIREKVRTLKSMQGALQKLVRECSGRGPVTGCPILEALEPLDGY